jgi:hypothetical protein
LELDGDELRAINPAGAEQHFVRSEAASNAPLGGSFERRCTKPSWAATGRSSRARAKAPVRFSDTGNVTGLPGVDRFAVCLAGDCATMGGGNDSMWLERNQRGAPWIFKRDGDTLEIFQAVNRAQPDEMPSWLPASGSGCWRRTNAHRGASPLGLAPGLDWCPTSWGLPPVGARPLPQIGPEI